MAELNFEAGGPPPIKKRGYVRRVELDHPVLVTIVSKRWWHKWVHWAGYSVPCTLAEKGSCDTCSVLKNRKYLGYLWVHNETDGKFEHLELPHTTAFRLNELIGGEEHLRGSRVKLTRAKSKTGAIIISLESRVEIVSPKRPLGPDRDPTPVLEWLWKRSRDLNKQAK